MKNIVVPSDYSTCSAKALKLGAAIAGLAGAKLHLVHQISLLNQAVGEDALLAEQFAKAEADFHDGQLRKFAERTLGKEALATLKLHTEVLTGFNPVSLSAVYAKKVKAEMIVMGTEGATGLKRLFVGSYAVRLMEQAECPVLLIPRGQKQFYLKKVAIASALDGLYKHVKTIAPLLKILNASLDVVHIEPVFPAPAANKAFNPDKAIEKLKKDNALSDVHYKPVITRQPNDFHGGINKYIRQENPDALVMIHHKRNWLSRILDPSRTSDMAYQLKLPLLVLKD